MKIANIIYVSYRVFYKYVTNKNKKDYKEEFYRSKRYDSRFALKFFPKYIDFEKHAKKPKNPYDILLINYWIIEVPVLGVKKTDLLKSYFKGNKILDKYLVENNIT